MDLIVQLTSHPSWEAQGLVSGTSLCLAAQEGLGKQREGHWLGVEEGQGGKVKFSVSVSKAPSNWLDFTSCNRHGPESRPENHTIPATGLTGGKGNEERQSGEVVVLSGSRRSRSVHPPPGPASHSPLHRPGTHRPTRCSWPAQATLC